MSAAVFAGLSDICYCCQAAHLSLIDALMMAWCATVASVDRVVQAVRSGPVHFLSPSSKCSVLHICSDRKKTKHYSKPHLLP